MTLVEGEVYLISATGEKRSMLLNFAGMESVDVSECCASYEPEPEPVGPGVPDLTGWTDVGYVDETQTAIDWGNAKPDSMSTRWSSEVTFDLTDIDPRLFALLYGLPLPEVRCDWSDLITTQCAHCLGHDSSWLDTDTVKFYD